MWQWIFYLVHATDVMNSIKKQDSLTNTQAYIHTLAHTHYATCKCAY